MTSWAERINILIKKNLTGKNALIENRNKLQEPCSEKKTIKKIPEWRTEQQYNLPIKKKKKKTCSRRTFAMIMSSTIQQTTHYPAPTPNFLKFNYKNLQLILEQGKGLRRGEGRKVEWEV